ncbi:MAG: hypothetical protein LC660_08265 [Desulfobacteraceae bacterium]|nr:hypothetical protein [Desulfobacteraceae bacterium]
MFTRIKKYFQKAKQEIDKEYAIPASDTDNTIQNRSMDDGSEPVLPKLWTGIDLDGTLARDNGFSGMDCIGEPVPAMLALVRKMLNNGIRIKICTARAGDPEQIPIIRQWLRDNNLPELEITNTKDYQMQRLYDDRCIQVERNTGRLIVDN